jgi:hypothetical protein
MFIGGQPTNVTEHLRQVIGRLKENMSHLEPHPQAPAVTIPRDLYESMKNNLAELMHLAESLLKPHTGF